MAPGGPAQPGTSAQSGSRDRAGLLRVIAAERRRASAAGGYCAVRSASAACRGPGRTDHALDTAPPLVSAVDRERQLRARGRGATGVRPPCRWDVPGHQDRIAPVVEADALGEQLGTDAVAVAGDRIEHEPEGHRHGPWRTGTGRTAAAPA